MDFDFPSMDDPRRADVRAWLEKNPKPTPRQLLESGYEVPHWPKPYGLGADPELQLIISQELDRAGVHRNGNLLSATNLGPSLMTHGTPAAKERFLEKMLMGEERWAQMMSEPDAGSDLAALRTSAVRDGEEYVVNGVKIWSNGGAADFGCVIVRTDPHAAKHAGLSVLIIDLKGPGVTSRPIYNMNQDPSDFKALFYEVFFDNVRVPVSNLIGQEGDG
ncbi:MAG: acyl-CoA dehydrogenase family protein [Phenylobacterium sp.]|uniref:acyl-CoA dehydrogenase family protein n=1 Tax=Phenylobacterium sp. TaxID=1871053 RepID=UPI00273301B9|nr:acyl-CoA dehydrogenase family protein [Phenylobacterium sp.]MDP3174639.1 acyl-CoA dehydrogenase family protein [Phenylobacterium sp.]